MKRYFTQVMRYLMVALTVVGGVVSCTPTPPEQQPEPDEASVVVSTQTLDFDWTYCEQSFDVSSPAEFLVWSNSDWIAFDQTEFIAGDYTITVAAYENPYDEIREGTIFISAAGYGEVKIEVYQAPNNAEAVFKAITERVSVNSDEQTAYIEVNSGKSFTVATTADWITVPTETFEAGEKVRVPIEVVRNRNEEVRQAKVTLTNEREDEISITVEQDAFKPTMTVPTDTLRIDNNGGKLQIAISSEIDYNVTSNSVWVVADSTTYAASTNSVVTLTVESTENTYERIARIKIDGGNSRVYDIVLVQTGRVPSAKNEIKSITLRKSQNKGLDRDYVMKPDENGVFSCYIPAIKNDEYIHISGKDVRFDRITPFDIENAVVEIESDAYRIFSGYDLMPNEGQFKCDLSNNKTLKAVAENGEVRNYEVKVTYFTGLPIVYINLDSNKEVASKEVYEGGTIHIVGAGDIPGIPEQRFEMHGRGNSSWGTFRKKPSYTFKLDSKQSVGGMPEHKKWVMIGNYRDKTLLRNEVAWWCSQHLPGLAWTPRHQQMELVLNGTHRGVYQVAEQVRIDKNRVNIAEMSPTDTQGEAITGGYIVEFHYGSDAQQWCWDMPYMRGGSGASVKIPKIEDSNTAQRDYIMNYVMTIDNWFASGKDIDKLMETYIDIPSWVAQWLVFEISGTTEPQGPNSWYTYKQRGDDKWYCGPAWDFDYRSYRPSEGKRWTNAAVMYLPEMLSYRPYKDELVRQWRTYLEPILPDLLQYIEERRETLRRSANANWRIHDQNLIDDNRHENGDENIPWDEALDRMIQYLEYKWEFMSQNITKL